MHSWCGFESGSVLLCRMFGEGWTGRLAQGQTDRQNKQGCGLNNPVCSTLLCDVNEEMAEIFKCA